MKFKEVPPEQQKYVLVLSNKSEYMINGATKKAIMESKSQFVELDRGDIINKSFIAEIKADIEETRSEINTRLMNAEYDEKQKLLQKT